MLYTKVDISQVKEYVECEVPCKCFKPPLMSKLPTTFIHDGMEKVLCLPLKLLFSYFMLPCDFLCVQLPSSVCAELHWGEVSVQRYLLFMYQKAESVLKLKFGKLKLFYIVVHLIQVG